MKGKLILKVEEAKQFPKKWEEIRKQGIGGSDIACIMGYNDYKSPYTLWTEKTGLVEPPDLKGNEYVEWGTKLEPLVASSFTEKTGKKVRKCGTLADEEYSFLHANVDRLVVGENAGLECKTANAFKVEDWEGEEVPDAYYCQCQWYMMVTGAELWYIACLIGGNHFEWKPIPRDEAFIKEMRETAILFWQENVQKNIPPAVDGSDSTTETLNKMFDEPKEDTVMLPSVAGSLIQRLDELATTKKLLESEISMAQNKLKELLGNSECGMFNDRKVSWKMTAPRVTIDTKLLKAELPDIYQKYAKTGKASRRFSLK